MTSKKSNPSAQDFYALNSLLTHYNSSHKKSSSEVDLPEPEQCPKPHSVNSNSSDYHSKNLLSVPSSNANDMSFRSQSSRADYSKRSNDPSRRYDYKRSMDYSKRSNSPFASPRTTPQEMERMLIIEQQIKVEKEKYKKLEKKYKELMATQSLNQGKFENLVQDLQKKLEEKQGKSVNLESISLEVKDIKGTVNGLLMRLDGLLDTLDMEEVTKKSDFK
jgi:hypothetical protein